jgi:hypothetical protein
MKTSESIKTIAPALVQFSSEVGKIAKKSENPFFKNKYAALPDILSAIAEPLHKSGLTVIQLPCGDNQLETIILHTSGEWIGEAYALKPVKNDPQSMGSAITYARRYAIGAMLNLNIDIDDDGNKASEPQKEQKQQVAQTTQAQLPELKPEDKAMWDKFVTAMKGGCTIEQFRTKWTISDKTAELLAMDAKEVKPINK